MSFTKKLFITGFSLLFSTWVRADYGPMYTCAHSGTPPNACLIKTFNGIQFPDGSVQTTAASGGSSIDTLGTFDGQSPAAAGGTISGNSLFFQSATVSVPGMVNNADQSFSGVKTFSSNLNAANFTVLPNAVPNYEFPPYPNGVTFMSTETDGITLGVSNTMGLGDGYNLVLPPAAPSAAFQSVLVFTRDGEASWQTYFNGNSPFSGDLLGDSGSGIGVNGGDGAIQSVMGGTNIFQLQSSASQNGYLSSTDWSTFNSKLGTLNPTANNFINQQTNTASSASAITLTSSSNFFQNATGTHNQTYKLPSATGLTLGTSYLFKANTTQTVTINNTGNGFVGAIGSGGALLISLDDNGTSNGSWTVLGLVPAQSSFTNDGLGVIGAISTDSQLISNQYIGGFNSTVTSAQTVTMSNTDTQYQESTGSSTITYKLPSTVSLIEPGNTFTFFNTSSGNATIQSSAANTVAVLAQNQAITVVNNTVSSDGATAWDTSSNGSGSISIGAFGSSPNSSGLTLSGGVLTLQPADGTHPGALSTGSQTIAGAKTFSTSLASSTSLSAGANAGTGGTLILNGVTSGAVTVTVPSSFTSYNFNLPTTSGASGQLLASAGGLSSAMTWVSALSNPMSAVGDLIIGGTSGAATRLALGAQYSVPQSNGTTVAYDAIHLDQNGVSGTLPLTHGGLGISSGTSGGVPYFSASSTLASSGALSASQLVLGGGSGSAPTSLAAGSQYSVLVMGASNPAYGAVNLSSSQAVANILPNANTTANAGNTASAIVARDSNGNFSANNASLAYTSTASANQSVTLSAASAQGQRATGSSNITYKLPDVSTLPLGTEYEFFNESSGTMQLQSSAGSGIGNLVVGTIAQGQSAIVKSNAITGTDNSVWDNILVTTTAGSVTSVGVNIDSSASFLTSSGGPITTTGNITLAASNQTANKFLASPSGSTGAPSFRTLATGDFKAPNPLFFPTTGTAVGYYFVCSNCNAVAGDTYTNNGHTYTIVGTWISSNVIFATQASAPSSSGTLTRTSGSGDATIVFSREAPIAQYTMTTSPRSPLYLKIKGTGAGGGGAGSGVSLASAGANGLPTYLLYTGFGTELISAQPGTGATAGSNAGGAGGSGGGIGSFSGQIFDGQAGGGANLNMVSTLDAIGGMGGNSIYFPGGAPNPGPNSAGSNGVANTGSGGAGGSTDGTSGAYGGAGGGGGESFEVIASGVLLGNMYYAIGTGGAGSGTGDIHGKSGGNGSDGILQITEYWQ